MKKLAIYEPALCCETGLCGVNVDPELLRITTVLASLKEKGIAIDRFNLKSAPMEFVKNNVVNQYLNTKGVEGLPCATLDGNIVIEGRYPQNDEILNLLELPAETLLPEGATVCCCGDSSGCCSSIEKPNNSCCCDDPDCCSDGSNNSCCC